MTRMVQLIVAAGLLAACSAYKPFTPATVQAPADPFNKSVRVLVGRGESIETKDEGAKKWKDCGDQPKERTDLAKAIADEISR